MPSLLADTADRESRRDEVARSYRPIAAAAALVVLSQVVFAQLTMVIAGCLLVAARIGRWRPVWLLAPAGVGLAWVLVAGATRSLVGYLGVAHALAGHMTAAGPAIARMASLRSVLSLWRTWLPAQLPFAMVAGAAEAAVAMRLGAAGQARSYRPGLIAAARRAQVTAALRRGERATAGGGCLGVVPDTGRPVAVTWREAEGGVLCTGRERRAVTATGLDLVIAAIQHRKTVIVIDPGGGSARVIESACTAAGAPLRSGPVAEISLPDALACRQVVLVAPSAADLTLAGLAATLAQRSQAGVPEDCLVWVDGCEAIEPATLVAVLGSAERAGGTAVVLGTASARTAARLAGRVNVTVAVGPAPAGLGDPRPGELAVAVARPPRLVARCRAVP